MVNLNGAGGIEIKLRLTVKAAPALGSDDPLHIFRRVLTDAALFKRPPIAIAVEDFDLLAIVVPLDTGRLHLFRICLCPSLPLLSLSVRVSCPHFAAGFPIFGTVLLWVGCPVANRPRRTVPRTGFLPVGGGVPLT
ncbi:hypothetical protein DESA109040_05940 [Deinococcus saxicola]|uniref:hypothetical protein n=1 Tax=Deinococcus saxicola TaxID=249406 RepID=UPI0039F0EA0C